MVAVIFLEREEGVLDDLLREGASPDQVFLVAKQVGEDRPEKFEWTFTNRLYDSLYFYSPDSNYFLDLRSILLDKDSNPYR